MSGVACEIYVYPACCYNMSLVVALRNKRRITKPLWFCAFNHPFTGLVNLHNTTFGDENGYCVEEEYSCFGLVRKIKTVLKDSMRLNAV